MVSETRGEKAFGIINIFIMFVFAVIVAVPVLYVLSNSFVSLKESLANPYLIIPKKISFIAYKLIFTSSDDIIDGFKVTILRVGVGTAFNIIFTYFLAYALSKKDLPGAGILTTYIVIPMLFYGGMIPTYIVVKNTGLSNNFWVYIIPGLVSIYNVLILRNFILQIHPSLMESAEIDGAHETTMLFRIVFPLTLPAMATVSLYYAVGHWNSWWDAFLYVTDSKLYPIQMVLRNILYSGQVSFTANQANALTYMQKHRPPARTLQNAAVVVSTVPIVLVYPYVQKYFVKGIAEGAVKG